MKHVSLYLSAEGKLVLVTPSPVLGRESGVNITQDEAGMRVILRVLTSLCREGSGTLGKEQAPTQGMVNAWLKENIPQRENEMRAKANASELGL